MTINGGSSHDESEELKRDRRKSVGGIIGNALTNYYPPPEYIDADVNVPRRKVKKRMRLSGDVRTRTQGQLQPKTALKRHKFSLTHFPRGITRRKEEALIKHQNYRPENIAPYRRRSPLTHHSRNARLVKRREPRYRKIYSPGYLKNLRDWSTRSKYSGDTVEMDGPNPFEPCAGSCLAEDLTPGTYMVQIEPESEDDCDDETGTCTVDRGQSTCSKCYYLFERKPFKVKFLNYVPPPFEDTVPPRPAMATSLTEPSLSEVPVKISMPPFQCLPPECREVLYCKYFQCTSLGFFPDSRNCRKYFFCDLNSNGFVLYHMLCPKGRIFDPNLRECRLKEIMNERDVQRCRAAAAKLRRNEKMRIKKDEYENLIKYKTHQNTQVMYSPNGRWRRRRLYRVPEDGLDARRNATAHKPRSMMYQTDVRNHPKYRRTKSYQLANYTIPKYCEMLLTMTQSSTEESHSPATTQTTSTSTELATTSEHPTTTTTSSTDIKTTIPACSPSDVKNKTCQSTKKEQYYLGDLDSDAYQEDMQDDEYDGYYDGDYVPEDDYEWLRQGLTEYLDKLKNKKESNVEEDKNSAKEESSTEGSTSARQKGANENQEQKVVTTLADQQTEIQPFNDSDRGKRSREKSSTSTAAPAQIDPSIMLRSLPYFERSYNEGTPKNLDGYPCMEYARYPDKFDSVCYYECGAQPDGKMKVEHKCCSKDEEFSPQYLECVATGYLKMTHRKRSASNRKKPAKKPFPDQDDNYEDDKEVPNEWLDASHTNKVPNEFKSKTKDTLRIFHLQCRRNASEDLLNDHKHNTRSFTVQGNKKDVTEKPEKEEDDDDDEEYDDEEDYEEDAEKTTTETQLSSERTQPIETPTVSTTSKVLLDADIHVGRDFENALRNILGKTSEQEKDQKRDSKDSILIRLQAPKLGDRPKRNFLKGIFSKKSKTNGDTPEKEGVVSMLALINGLPSEYERDTLLQKLERRKMMNSRPFRTRQGNRKRKKSE